MIALDILDKDWLERLRLKFRSFYLSTACTVGGNAGNGTAEGTCPFGLFCQANGECTVPGRFRIFM